jgi:hypothetical protein
MSPRLLVTELIGTGTSWLIRMCVYVLVGRSLGHLQSPAQTQS